MFSALPATFFEMGSSFQASPLQVSSFLGPFTSSCRRSRFTGLPPSLQSNLFLVWPLEAHFEGDSLPGFRKLAAVSGFERPQATLGEEISAIQQKNYERRNSFFLKSLRKDLIYFANIPCDHYVFVPLSSARNSLSSSNDTECITQELSLNYVRVYDIAGDENVPWQNYVLGNGSKGSIFAKDKCVRVINSIF
jgi:hypothetical protein